MKVLPVLVLCASVLATGRYDRPNMGYLSFPYFDLINETSSINVDGDHLAIKDGSTECHYDKDTSTLKVPSLEKYVSVDEQGLFTLSDRPDPNFTLQYDRQTVYESTLYYKGNYHFQACGNNQIGYQSECEDSKGLQIIFSENPRVLIPRSVLQEEKIFNPHVF
ncbi:hypothetical protein JCM33374_g6123 [Metschnikowia sp. JCM 33374]|nr:hypothetical protein JCM33374_g6123 [Metschnikowia sp. JCM 33374]